jgi:hypothetical protein
MAATITCVLCAEEVTAFKFLAHIPLRNFCSTYTAGSKQDKEFFVDPDTVFQVYLSNASFARAAVDFWSQDLQGK